MSITIFNSYNNIGFKINSGDDFSQDKERLKLVTGRIPIYKDDKFSHWEIEKPNLKKLFEVYGNKILIQDDAKEFVNHYRLQTSNISKLPKMSLEVKSKDGKILHHYQEDFVCIYHKRKGVLGLMDMGAGKTICSLLRAINIGFERLLIVAPAQILTEWQADIEDILGLESILYTGSIAKAKREKIDLAAAKVIVCNYEMLKELNTRKIKIDSVIADEVHTAGKGTVAYKELKKLVRKVQKLDGSNIGLTATPIEKDIEDLWYLTHLFNPELAGDKNSFLSKFREATYYINIPNPNDPENPFRKPVKFRTKNTEELQEFIAAAGVRIKKEVFLKVKNNSELVKVKMTTKQKEIYDKIRDDIIIQSQNKLFFLNNPLTRLLKLLEAAEGAYNIYPELEEESGKLDYITYQLEQCQKSGRKAIVWFRFKRGSDILHSWYPNSSVLINGDASAASKFMARCAFESCKNESQRIKFNLLKQKYDFQFEESEAQFLFITYNERSGMGINLPSTDLQYVVSTDFSATSLNQALGRIQRPTSKFDDVFSKILASEGTIEDRYIKMVLTKIENSAKLLDGNASIEAIRAREIIRML